MKMWAGMGFVSWAMLSTALASADITCRVSLSKASPPAEECIEFTESDMVHAALSLSNLEDGPYSLLGEWFNGVGQKQDEARVSAVASKGVANAQMWLKFISPPIFTFFSTRETWLLRIRLGDKILASKTFYVWR